MRLNRPNSAKILAFFQEEQTAAEISNKLRRHKLGHVEFIRYDPNNRSNAIGSHPSELKSAYSRLLVRGETLVLVSTSISRTREALDILRQHADIQPVTFVFYPESGPANPDGIASAMPEPMPLDRLIELARELSLTHRIKPSILHGQPLLKNLIESEKTLKLVRQHLSEAARVEQNLLLSAEWLLDNAYIIQGHIADFKRNLPRRYYEQLPILETGKYAGLPRIYAIAAALSQATDGTLKQENIYSFLQSYQSTTSLTIGELWVFPLMLRLTLIERLYNFALTVDLRQREREQADYWANRLLTAARVDPDQTLPFLTELSREYPNPTAHFADQLVSHLYDEESALLYAHQWLERKLASPLSEAAMTDQKIQAVQQISLGNAINSLRTISQLDWRDTFESVCRVDHVLNADPAGIYSHMSFATRDRYRHAIEEISRNSSHSETEVAFETLRIAEEHTDEAEHHIGYFLIDKGREELENRLHCKVQMSWKIRRFVRSHPTEIYLGSVSILTAFLIAAVVLITLRSGYVKSLPILSILALLPASEIAIQLINYLVTRLMPPVFLPRMSFEHGIPDNFRSLVVVPMMLLTPDSIRDEFERLEIRYLANTEENLLYGLLFDFSDAPQKDMPEDAELLDVAIRAVERLSELYGRDKFFLFHRQREWSSTEDRWMGWERKRGKLEHLNAYLSGESLSSQPQFLRFGDEQCLKNIRFIITLDSDTILPRSAALKMVETLAHPLNTPRLSEDGLSLLRGYTLLQPRVSTSLPSATASLFSSLFTDTTGTDPYTNVVSDVYQDLQAEGSYHGKGIYDLAAFHTLLRNRFPASKLLSHDLLEGTHVRIAFVSDIELYDLFPRDYIAYTARQHRWVRGDWQIIDWMFPKVPAGSSAESAVLNEGIGDSSLYKNASKAPKVRNPLSLFNRWKIFDNLRRSLLPAGCIAMLVASWFAAPNPVLWTWLIAITMFMPSIIGVLGLITSLPQRDTRHWHQFGVSFLRCIVFSALLPHQALLSLDAIARVFYRRIFSHKLMLEWETASETHKKSKNRRTIFLLSMSWIPLAAVLVVIAVQRYAHDASNAAAPFLILWIIVPLVVAWLNEASNTTMDRNVSESDRKFLRLIARQTWRFFDTFVSSETNWLPPDNYQAQIRIEVAPRTSPTNIGLWFLAVLAAQDMGYLTVDDALDRLLATVNTMDRLERFEGHFLNWYDIYKVKALFPRYISMVDSGNLLGHLWTFAEGCEEKLSLPVLDSSALRGIEDCAELIREAAVQAKSLDASLQKRLESITTLCSLIPSSDIVAILERVRSLAEPAYELSESLRNQFVADSQVYYWAEQLLSQVKKWNSISDRYLTWLEHLQEVPPEGLLALGAETHEWRRAALSSDVSLRELAAGSVPGISAFVSLKARIDLMTISEPLRSWLDKLLDEFHKAEWFAGEKLAAGETVLSSVRRYSDETNMRFLYDEDRKVFTIGYNVDDRRRDNSFYDLLASESRLGSFVSIARNEIPAEHWFALGRPFSLAYGQRVMLSWSGTMFEYLMPLLVQRSYDNSLLNQVCRAAVAAQISYGKERGIPWGISEAGYSAIDNRQVYQYQAFGVPGLGIKRGLEEDTVIAPYATIMALMVAPQLAVSNLRRMSKLAPNSLRGIYGFYESLDYTRQRDAAGDPGVIVYEFMAHHQGMSLLAIDNLLNADIMQERFHRDTRVKATESLLFERTATSRVLAKDYANRAPLPRLKAANVPGGVGRVDGANTVVPRTHLLSNTDYCVMVTNAGSGYSKWKDTEITRWRADATRDDWGSFCYLCELETGETWSAAHQPTGVTARTYSALFSPEKAEFRRRDTHIETITEIFVSPEDNAEIRRITLVNHSSRPRTIELTSYAEISLAPHAADRSHPAFSKLFVQTEAIEEYDALLACRRPRSAKDPAPWAVHVVAMQKKKERPLTYETDRLRFLGRGRSARNPAALTSRLSNTAGAVLDPIFSLRVQVRLEPGERSQVSFITGAGDTREEVAHLAEKYYEIANTSRAVELAWTHAQLDLRHLRIQPDEALRYQQLASYVLYPSNRMRAGEDRLRRNHLHQAGLWAFGISGDLPILLITVESEDNLDLVQQAIQAHSYWRVRGMHCDLVILNEESEGYNQPLQERLRRMVQTYEQTGGLDSPGGVFIRPANQLDEDTKTLLFTVARVVMIAARGSLAQQLVTLAAPPTYPSALPVLSKLSEEPSAPLPFMELAYFNGIGGFTPDGSEYVIYLGPNDTTPAPWVNVMANPNFGAIVSESGGGFCWYGNSQSNRLTVWSNDPVRDPVSDAIYLRDDDLGVVWTPTPAPIREQDAYRIHHGQGYTRFEHNSHAIEQELITFVPMNDSNGEPVRVQRLRLKNASSHHRKITAIFYVEWTLGVEREDTQMHVVTQWDAAAKILSARNAYHPDFGTRIAFVSSSPVATSWTGDRTEFIGRNGELAEPAALLRRGMTGKVGAGLDPCAVLQSTIELEPGETVELFYVIGQGADSEEVKRLALKYRDPKAVERALQETIDWWNKTLQAIQVDTPDLGVNFLLNRWLLYQDLSCRLWGRSAFYQSGGAFGFRDQLQDVCATVYADPQATRDQLLRSASRQFVEGDVQHWWHPPSGMGVRTQISDDLLWLTYCTAHYIRVTGDAQVLDDVVPFLEGTPLASGEHESLTVPNVSAQTATLLEHCRRTIQKGLTSGPHGLPLIGAGDWNDGLNRVGIEGKGESVWLAWFIIQVLHDFAYLLKLKGESEEADSWELKAKTLAAAIEKEAWDGEWYRRAYFDDGTPLGSAKSDEAKIDSLPQSWSVISGAGDPQRSKTAMASVERYLVKEKEKMVLLFTPPFNKTAHDPGYIKGYLPGVRENGGQYTHGSLWTPLAFARLGNGDTAVRLLSLMNPIEHARTKEEAEHYKVEPYVVCADVYALQSQTGRGGWTWYTGSAGWMYRVWIEEVLGLQVRGNALRLAPVLPRHWPSVKLTYRYRSTFYSIEIENPDGISRGVISVTLDDQPLLDGTVPLVDDNGPHTVIVVMGETTALPPAPVEENAVR